MKIKKLPKSYVKYNYAFIIFYFQARKQQTVKRDKRQM